MAYHYKATFRKKPGTQEGKYYAQIKSIGKIEVQELANEIGALTALNSTDVKSVIDAFIQVIPQHLTRGFRVNLGELGSFSVTARSEGQKSPDLVTANCINHVRPRFLVGKSLRKAIEDIKFEREGKKEAEEVEMAE